MQSSNNVNLNLKEKMISETSSQKPNSPIKTKKLSELIIKILSNKQIFQGEQQYQTYLARILASNQLIVQDFQRNKNFSFQEIIQTQQIEEEIVKIMVECLKSENLFSVQLRNKIRQIELWQTNGTNPNPNNENYKEIIKMLITYIQSNKEISGVWDLAFTTQSDQMQKQLNKFFKRKQNQSQNKKQKLKWFIHDYLQVQKQINNITKSNQNQILPHRYIFQIKSNPFQLPDKEDQEKKKRISNWLQHNKNIKSKFQQYQNILYENQQNQQIIRQKFEQIKNNGNFKQIFIFKLIQNNMLHIISQIIIQSLATIYEYYQRQSKEFVFCDYLECRSQNKQFIKIKINKHPKIVFYFILNSQISKQRFQEIFTFFKPLLKAFFQYFGAVFHVVGFTQSEAQKNVLKQMQEIENQKILQLSEKIKDLEGRLAQTEKQLKIKSQKVESLEQQVNELKEMVQRLNKICNSKKIQQN